MADAVVAERMPDYSRLTRAEVASLLALSEAGKSQVEIAHILGCNQSNVSRWLTDLTDTRELAKHRLRNRALKLAESAIEGSVQAAKDGKPEHALELLDRLDVAPKRIQDAHANRIGVQVVIGMPGQSAGTDPLSACITPLSLPTPQQLDPANSG